MNTQFIDIGFSNYVEASKILTVNRPDSSPVKRTIQQAKESGNYLDLTQGKKTRSIITMKSETGIVIVASAVQTSTIIERIRRSDYKQKVVEKVSDKVIETKSYSS